MVVVAVIVVVVIVVIIVVIVVVVIVVGYMFGCSFLSLFVVCLSSALHYFPM